MLLFIFSILLIIFLIINSCFVSSKNIELYTQYFNDIPKVVYQTYKSYNDIPECVKKVMQHNISLNPEYEFKFFDDNAVETYIKKHTDKHIYDSFKKINSKCGACKADFFRYVIIYNEGGIYADIKTKFKVNLDSWINKSTKLKFTLWPWIKHSHLDQYYHPDFKPNSNNREINQAVILFPPKHPLLKKVIDDMIENIQSYHASNNRKSVLATTGPHLYTKAIAPQLKYYDYDLMENGDNLYDGNVIYDGTDGCYHNTQIKQNLRYTNIKDFIIQT